MSSRSFPQFFASLAKTLLLRPLLWICIAALLGVALGGTCARAWWGMAREAAPLWGFLPFVCVGLGLCWWARRNRWYFRAGCALIIIGFFAAYTARRLLAPQDDVSWLALKSVSDRTQPVRAPLVKVVGVIGDYPRWSRWNVAFPVDVERLNGKAQSGRIWVSVPFDQRLEVGDRLQLTTELRPLRRPGNVGEREEFWSQIGARCWCENGPTLELSLLKPGAAYPLERRVQGVRRALLHRYEALFASNEEALYKRPFPLANAALLTAMVWGEGGLPQPLPQQTRDDFRAAGLSHLLVASGSQVTATEPTFLCPGRPSLVNGV